MVLDGINNRVGIGNDAPNYMLDVSGDIRIGKGQQAGILHSGGDLQFYADGAKVIEMFTSGSDYVFKSFHDIAYFCESNVKVGIGTTAPSETLHVRGSDAKIFVDNSNASDGTSRSKIKFGNSGTTYMEIGHLYDSTAGDNAIQILEPTSGGTPLVTFKRDGNVGINQTSPDSWLHIEDDNTPTRHVLHLKGGGASGA